MQLDRIAKPMSTCLRIFLESMLKEGCRADFPYRRWSYQRVTAQPGRHATQELLRRDPPQWMWEKRRRVDWCDRTKKNEVGKKVLFPEAR
jgi:hypothetical protein